MLSAVLSSKGAIILMFNRLLTMARYAYMLLAMNNGWWRIFALVAVSAGVLCLYWLGVQPTMLVRLAAVSGLSDVFSGDGDISHYLVRLSLITVFAWGRAYNLYPNVGAVAVRYWLSVAATRCVAQSAVYSDTYYLFFGRNRRGIQSAVGAILPVF